MPESKTNPTQEIVRATVSVMGITVVVKALGFVEKLLLAFFFGTGLEADAYLIAVGIPIMIFILVREVIEPAFLPTFMGLINSGDERGGWRLFSLVSTSLLIVLFIVSLLGFLGAPSVISVLAPGFEGSRRFLTIKLTRIMMPAGLFLGLSALTYITHNSYKRFVVPALGDVAFKGSTIAILAASFKVLGILGIAVGVVCGAVGRLLVHFIGLWKKLRCWRPSLDFRYPPFRRMQWLMLPLIIGILFSQLSLIVDNMFASTLETGSVSALAYAKKLVEMPVVIVPYALSVVIFPFFSELALADEKEKQIELLIHAVRLIAFFFIPLAVGLIVLREPIVQLLFQRGAFDAHSTKLTSSALLYLSLGLGAFAVEAILVQFYFAMSDTATPIVVGILCVLFNILLTFLLIKYLSHCGIALALSISKTVKTIILYLLLRRQFPLVQWRNFLPFLLKVGLAALVMGLVVGVVSGGMQSIDQSGVINRLGHIIILSLIGGAVFVAIAAFMRLEEASLCWQFVRQKIGPRKN